MKRFLWLGLATVLIGGCAVGPNYKKPAVNSPAQFRGGPAAPGTNSLADLPWWDIYKDPVLTALIREAFTNNYDLRIAISRMEQARQVANQSRALYLPSAGYDGNVSRGRNQAFGNPSPTSGRTLDNALALASASWEVDLWGRVRRLNESARAQYLASAEAQHGVQLSLVANVAQAYFQLLELDEEMNIAKATTNSFGQSLQIFSQRLEGGVASKLETSRAEAALATTAAQVPELERQVVLQENQLCILLGRNPGPIARGIPMTQQALPPDVPAGLPSDLLARRPDVRQAERSVRAANAQIGVAVAEFLPKIGLTAFGGKVSPELSAFTGGTANAWSIAANATGPIFQGGALRAQYKQAKAAWQEACLNYDETALNAFAEVSGALTSNEKLAATRAELTRAVAAYETAVKVSSQRYVAGKSSYYEVLEAQQQLFPAQISLAQTQLNQLLTVVQLYKALGGGWNETNTVVTLK